MINLKNTVLALLALNVSGVASAQVYVPPPELPPPPVEVQTQPTKKAFYFGLGAGVIDLNTSMTTTGSVSLINDLGMQSIDSTADGSGTGVNGTGIVGFSFTTPNRFFMGMEGFYDLMSVSTNTSTTTSNTLGNTTGSVTGEPDTKMDYAYGFRVLPGYQATQSTVIYGIVGYSLAHATTGVTLSGEATNSNTAETASNSVTKDKGVNYTGYQVGIGSMIDVASHVALRGDFIYSGYGSETIKTGSQTSEAGTAEATLSSQPSTLEADVALIVKFD